MKIIARIKNDFKEKFGIPRQSGIVENTVGRIVFEPEYRNPDALRGIEGYSHLWLIWQFSEAVREEWSPTVRPPRLGGNTRVGVFATRSPFRPNPIGLSSVRLVGIERDEKCGTVLVVSGADLADGTPIYDIKPYLPFTDSHPNATAGFADGTAEYEAEVSFPPELLSKIEPERREVILALLRHDPHPSYKNDPERVYGMVYADYEIFFTASDGRIEVKDIKKQR
ncbi:MAG: tRNA (N6-threonylcarbamoyladenosine(37)-N6)-methyltransferase TrmO [Clostridia bacterium]|nr:tRNA (N6-threonylcarbamoyladenosine(37)-N6)-methyltransferase TrmO [Clostridia bacterium]